VSNWQVITGDCLEVLKTLPMGSVDASVTDPPYGINTKSDGNGKLSPWADLCNASLWYRTWMGECRRVLSESGCLWSFFNWRSLTTFQKASCDLGWPIESVLVWDKAWIGPGGSRGLRPSYEMVGMWAREGFSIEDRGIADIAQFKWASFKPTGHPAEKPVSLLAWLVAISGARTVCDPFCGSGSSGVAALQRGASFIGIEQDEDWANFARRRIAEAANTLWTPKQAPEQQGEMFKETT